jgi:septum formation protein
MALVLASASPRRRELLAMLGLEFAVVPAAGDEAGGGGAPGELVTAIALGKARQVAAGRSGDTVIAADTLVFLDGAPLGKPADERDAAQMLARLSGRAHEVYTGVAVLGGGRETAEFCRTRVRFRALDADEIARYIRTGEPMDKAGAYGAQGRGAVFIEGIEGDFFNVMGLPLCLLANLLKRDFGIHIL